MLKKSINPGLRRTDVVLTNPLKQLKCFANTHGGRHFNEKVDVVNSDIQFIDAELIFFRNFTNEPTNGPYTDELHRIFGILGLPNKVKSILSESMLKISQVHFFTPQNFMFDKFSSQEKLTKYFMFNQQLNNRKGNSFLGLLKAEVSLP